MVQLLWKRAWWFLKNLNMQLPYDLTILLIDIYPKELKAGTQTNVPSSIIIHSSQKVEIIQVSINKWTNKQNMVYRHNGIFIQP